MVAGFTCDPVACYPAPDFVVTTGGALTAPTGQCGAVLRPTQVDPLRNAGMGSSLSLIGKLLNDLISSESIRNLDASYLQ